MRDHALAADQEAGVVDPPAAVRLHVGEDAVETSSSRGVIEAASSRCEVLIWRARAGWRPARRQLASSCRRRTGRFEYEKIRRPPGPALSCTPGYSVSSCTFFIPSIACISPWRVGSFMFFNAVTNAWPGSVAIGRDDVLDRRPHHTSGWPACTRPRPIVRPLRIVWILQPERCKQALALLESDHTQGRLAAAAGAIQKQHRVPADLVHVLDRVDRLHPALTDDRVDTRLTQLGTWLLTSTWLGSYVVPDQSLARVSAQRGLNADRLTVRQVVVEHQRADLRIWHVIEDVGAWRCRPHTGCPATRHGCSGYFSIHPAANCQP